MSVGAIYTQMYGSVKWTMVEFSSLYTENKTIFMDYITYYQNLIQKLNAKISNFNRPVYLFRRESDFISPCRIPTQGEFCTVTKNECFSST